MSALRKLESSVQLVGYMNYVPLLIEARAKVNEASAKLPEGELKKELVTAMEAYERAGSLWYQTLSWSDRLSDVSDVISSEDRSKYSLPASGEVPRSLAMSAMWEVGSKNIARASALLEK